MGGSRIVQYLVESTVSDDRSWRKIEVNEGKRYVCDIDAISVVCRSVIELWSFGVIYEQLATGREANRICPHHFLRNFSVVGFVPSVRYVRKEVQHKRWCNGKLHIARCSVKQWSGNLLFGRRKDRYRVVVGYWKEMWRTDKAAHCGAWRDWHYGVWGTGVMWYEIVFGWRLLSRVVAPTLLTRFLLQATLRAGPGRSRRSLRRATTSQV